MLLLQITPKGSGGVSDFAAQLQGSWEREGIHSTIFPTDADSPPPSSLLESLASEPAVAILLHFSGYGYARRGLCRWLVRDLQNLLRSRPGIRLVTFFHELYAAGPPWRSAFWTGREHKAIALGLGGLSKAVWTNTAIHQEWLTAHLSPPANVSLMPVFSTIGEVAKPKPISQRTRRAVLFGSFAMRRQCLQGSALSKRLRKLGIESLTEIGHGPPAGSIDFPIEFLGSLPAPELSQILSETSYGLLHHEPQWLGKSTIFAAYASHGCVPILTAKVREDGSDLNIGRHYLDLASPLPEIAVLDEIGARVHAWYQPHRLQVQASNFKNKLMSS